MMICTFSCSSACMDARDVVNMCPCMCCTFVLECVFHQVLCSFQFFFFRLQFSKLDAKKDWAKERKKKAIWPPTAHLGMRVLKHVSSAQAPLPLCVLPIFSPVPGPNFKNIHLNRTWPARDTPPSIKVWSEVSAWPGFDRMSPNEQYIGASLPSTQLL